MSRSHSIISEVAERLFRDLAEPEVINRAEEGIWPDALWRSLEQAGLTLAPVPETAGGGGGTFADAVAVLHVAGRFAAPIPLAETMLAGWVLAGSRLGVPKGPLTFAPVDATEAVTFEPEGGLEWRLSGTAHRVPWARDAGHVVVLGEAGEASVVALVEASLLRPEAGRNLAGEPRDTIHFDGLVVGRDKVAAAGPGMGRHSLFLRGALARAAQMSGALERLLELSVGYAGERRQFGRAIAKFQAIQHYLAALAGHAATARAAVDGATSALAGNPEAAVFAVAVAKARAGEAAGEGAAIAHQVHGAMGFTYEHSLHHATRRLWSWRDEFGGESVWNIRLGEQVAATGADALWSLIAER